MGILQINPAGGGDANLPRVMMVFDDLRFSRAAIDVERLYNELVGSSEHTAGCTPSPDAPFHRNILRTEDLDVWTNRKSGSISLCSSVAISRFQAKAV